MRLYIKEKMKDRANGITRSVLPSAAPPLKAHNVQIVTFAVVYVITASLTLHTVMGCKSPVCFTTNYHNMHVTVIS